MKRYLSLFLLLLTLVCVSGCKDQSKTSELEANIEAANKICPTPFDLGTLKSIKYDKKSNVVTFTVEIYSERTGINLDSINNNRDIMLENLRLFISNESGKKVAKDISDADAGLKFIYKDLSTGKNLSVQLTSAELKDIASSDVDQSEINKRQLDASILMTNIQCPIEVDDWTTLIIVRDNGSAIIYNYEIDEEKLNMDDFSRVSNLVRDDLIEDFSNDPSLAELKRLMEANNRYLVHSYKGNKSGKQVDIEIHLSDIY